MPVSSTSDEQPADDIDGAALAVNEFFYSLQGKGKLIWTPSVSVRTSACDLWCRSMISTTPPGNRPTPP